jgi:hypothetical protein
MKIELSKTYKFLLEEQSILLDNNTVMHFFGRIRDEWRDKFFPEVIYFNHVHRGQNHYIHNNSPSATSNMFVIGTVIDITETHLDNFIRWEVFLENYRVVR